MEEEKANMGTSGKPGKHRIDRRSALFFTAMLSAWVAAGCLLFHATGGGFLGIFLGWCLGFLLLIPMGFLVRDLIARRPNSRGRLGLGVCSFSGLAVLSLCLIGNLVMTWKSNPVRDLRRLPPDSGYTRTRFEFHKDGKHFVIRDPGSRLRFHFGAAPAEIRVEGSERIVVFHDPVTLKSWTLGYGFGKEGIHFGGWMGAIWPEPELEIGPMGRRSPVEPFDFPCWRAVPKYAR